MPGPNKKIGKLLDMLDKETEDLFSSTYHSSGLNKKLFNQVSDELTTSIQNAIKNDSNYSDISNTTRLYEKLFNKTGGVIGSQNVFMSTNGKPTGITDIFNDNRLMANLMETYANTKWIKVLDDEIDMCVKYMPKLQIALNIRKNNVLCSDSFSRSFINVSLDNAINIDNNDKFTANSKYILEEYEFEKKCEEWYDLASKYGEAFVYVVPYKKALSELLARKRNTNYAITETTILEGGKLGKDIRPKVNSEITKSEIGKDACIKLTLNKTCILTDSVEAIHEASKKLQSYMCKSIYTEMLSEASGDKTIKLDKTIDDQLTYDDDSAAATDGLVGAKQQSEEKVKTPGCVLKTIDHGRILPMYIEDICLGYYNVNLSYDNLVDVNTSAVSNGYNSITSMFNNTNTENDTETGDRMLKYISGKIAESIDAAFINANQDLRKEIYMMLKYNDKFNQVANTVDMNVTFIPAEDIVHIKFNEDPKTHRGRSDLWDGLIAAKMWIMINSTSVIGNVTRGQDKRVYYVKTMVESNVAKTLLNVVSQIKKGNFGLRQMESINNILNIVGKFNDFVIPVGPSGDSPVTFDIMQGQQFELPTELMNNLEDSAVSCICPLEIVNSSMNMDFAIRYTMTNDKLLRDALKRQNYICKPFSKIFTKLYNCEFNDNVTCKVTLPPPVFLMITQGSQMIQNAVQYIDSLADVEMQGKDDDDRNMFRQDMLHHYLPSYIDTDLINKVKKEIEIKKNIKKTEDEIKSGGEQM